jgi:hypothetical protein
MEILSLLEKHKMALQSEESSQKVPLSTIIAPSVFRLSFNSHSKGFGDEHLKSSSDSDY